MTSLPEFIYPLPFEPVEPPLHRQLLPMAIPMVGDPYGLEPQQRLYERRRLLVVGPLDRAAVVGLVTALMALDDLAADRVELVVSGAGGRLADLLTLLDVIGLMRSKVDALCIAPTSGTAAALVTCASGIRRASSSATMSLRGAADEVVSGSVDQIREQTEELLGMQCVVAERISAATGQTAATAQAWLADGPVLSAAAAVDAGILDEIAGGSARPLT